METNVNRAEQAATAARVAMSLTLYKTVPEWQAANDKARQLEKVYKQLSGTWKEYECWLNLFSKKVRRNPQNR